MRGSWPEPSPGRKRLDETPENRIALFGEPEGKNHPRQEPLRGGSDGGNTSPSGDRWPTTSRRLTIRARCGSIDSGLPPRSPSFRGFPGSAFRATQVCPATVLFYPTPWRDTVNGQRLSAL